MLMINLGKTAKWGPALMAFYGALNDAQAYEVRQSIYACFFSNCPVGQDFFKQYTTYLHYIVNCVFSLTLPVYNDPIQFVDVVLGLGLCHVGYGIPTEYSPKFTSSAINVVAAACSDLLTSRRSGTRLGCSRGRPLSRGRST